MSVMNAEEKENLAERLAFLYLEKSSETFSSPRDFAEAFFSIKREIRSTVRQYSTNEPQR